VLLRCSKKKDAELVIIAALAMISYAAMQQARGIPNISVSLHRRFALDA
jgi:hypothetical protein